MKDFFQRHLQRLQTPAWELWPDHHTVTERLGEVSQNWNRWGDATLDSLSLGIQSTVGCLKWEMPADALKQYFQLVDEMLPILSVSFYLLY